MKVLGIESSCDETGLAIYDSEAGLLADALYSQIEIHAEYGGVVPELASRDHIRKTLPLLQQALEQAGIQLSQLDGIGYTKGPGLAGALLVGSSIACSLAWSLDIPAIGVHHMEGHLLAPMLEENPPSFPFLALLVSGGHTLLVQVNGLGDYQILGESLDDAVGEAFDKTAKLLGLGYPGGPALAKLAEQGDASQFDFPRPMTDRPGLDFSFSGLKTFVRNTIHNTDGQDADIAAAFQQAVVETLVIKCKRALQQTGLQKLVIAGGVSANQCLRMRLAEVATQLNIALFYPRLAFCTDNGAMIAYTACQRLLLGQYDELDFAVKPRWPLTDVCS